MLIALPLAIAMVAGLAWRHADGPGGKRLVLGVAALALGVRLLAVFVVSLIAAQTHGTRVWLSDEASFFLATESLLPNPFDKWLPQGLDHLGGDGYLGLTTVLAMAGGVADANAFRVVNASLGAMVVVLSTLIARRLFGPKPALIVGFALAVWPTLVMWSATMLRDTLASIAVVGVWWTLGHAQEHGWLRVLGTVFFAVVIALSLRPYLGGAMLAGVGAWAAYPALRRLSPRALSLLGAGAVCIAVIAVVTQARQIEFETHDLFYRQTVTKMELLGRLYTDVPAASEGSPMKPGTVVGLRDPQTGWILGGLIQDFVGKDIARVAFTDESIREVPVTDIVPIQSTDIPPLQLVSWILPNLGSYLAGTSVTSEPNSPVWIALALAWDVVLVLGVFGVLAARLSPRVWLYPLCITAGTILALITIPGAPGNADRHRATQTIPLLLVLAAGLTSLRAGATWRSGLALVSNRTRPAREAAPASSRMRSA